MKFAVIITLKKDVLDPQGKVIEQTLQNMGMNLLKNLRQGKYIEFELEEKNEKSSEENGLSKNDSETENKLMTELYKIASKMILIIKP